MPPALLNHGITKVQQIDSLNAVAVGDSLVILRTFDGGSLWQRQYFPNRGTTDDPLFPGTIADIHFSDSHNGIIAIADTLKNIFTTSDGGRHWNLSSFGGAYLWQCHSYGNSKFRLLKYGHGPFYTTINDFKTVDSTKEIFDSVSDPEYRYVLGHATFGGGDTMLAYGSYWPKDTIHSKDGLIMRSLDGGQHWEHPYTFPIRKISAIDYISQLDHDTVYAAGESNYNIVISIDRGASWKSDTIRIDTNYSPIDCYGITMTGDGHPVGIFSPTFVQSILTRGEAEKSHVEVIERVKYFTYLYPNPTSRFVNIETIDVLRPIRVVDIFGREIMKGVLSEQGKLSIDFSRFSSGIYEVLIDHDGLVFSIGKTVVTGN